METDAIPVMRPLLPAADSLMPYLRAIDGCRTYSNMGPLSNQLSDRLRTRLAGEILPTANATVALSVALTAVQAAPGTLCVVPAWTFAASGHAIVAAGLVPFLVDVDHTSQALTPDLAAEAVARAPARVGAIMVISPFGAPLDPEPWQRFAHDHGVPVVVDAAAGFDTVQSSMLATVVSLHATKVLGAGEGGFIVCRDAAVMDRARAIANFGFAHGRRQAALPGFNAKASEYQAAVALAALDHWPATRAAFAATLLGLRRALPKTVAWPHGLGSDWVASTACVTLDGDARSMAAHCQTHAIATRRWWEDGLHCQPAFSTCPRLPLPVTDTLARRVLGLPCSVDMTTGEIDRIARAVACFPSADQPAT